MQRIRIYVNGIVQGVGFRPFVYNLAKRINLNGFVKNTPNGVEVEVEGHITKINNFINSLKSSPPPLADIKSISQINIPCKRDSNFVIESSPSSVSHDTLISPDISICDDCLKELFDPQNRRYHYPFINCTNCGPRYTIINGIPYDRPFTSMRQFIQCPKCQSEYDDPSNRRFHAQPNACFECGPSLWFQSTKGLKITDQNTAIDTAVKSLLNGEVIAIKGLGGFHIAVNASNELAINLLRQNKKRAKKPFAIMVMDIKTANTLANINTEEEKLLLSHNRPIVLLNKKPNNYISEAVAPDNNRIGIMLPYTPIHYLILQKLCESKSNSIKALVMTSGNISEEPIAIDNDDAKTRLSNIVNGFLFHNRDILIRVDDSVTLHLECSRRFIRRSRGYTPKPIFIKKSKNTVLAVGGELKNTICIIKKDKAFVSQHIGDITNIEAYEFFKSTIKSFKKILKVEPNIIVHDLHPQYLCSQWAKEQNVNIIAVQHHHAHLTSCMADNRLADPVIGIIMDGTGYGTDNTIWGGEVLIGDYNGFSRFAYFEPHPLPGGDSAIKSPWHTGISYLYKAYGKNIPELPFMTDYPIKLITDMIDKNFNCPTTSSCGRLFDAIASISGGRQTIEYEGQSAIEFMQSIESLSNKTFDSDIQEYNDQYIMLISPIIRSVVKMLKVNSPLSEISAIFHNTLIQLFNKVAQKAKEHTSINNVVLSGGVFQNDVLFSGLISLLEKTGFKVYTHKEVPCNDGGLSLGQAVIGLSQYKD